MVLRAKRVTIEQEITIKEGRGRGEVEVRVEVGAGAGVVQLVEAGREIGVEDASSGGARFFIKLPKNNLQEGSQSPQSSVPEKSER